MLGAVVFETTLVRVNIPIRRGALNNVISTAGASADDTWQASFKSHTPLKNNKPPCGRIEALVRCMISKTGQYWT